MKINQELKELSKTYCSYVIFLMDFLKPEDEENLHLFTQSFSQVKPKIRYILKPLRQNSQLTKPFFSLAERRALALLRSFCRKVRKNFVKYTEEIRLGNVSTLTILPSFVNQLDLNSRIAKISKNELHISFGKQLIKIDLDLEDAQDLKPIQIDLDKNELFLLAPSTRSTMRAQLGTRFASNLCHR
jgi:CDP-glycerol glycerophosphotransferase (TagB/SpsB family)